MKINTEKIGIGIAIGLIAISLALIFIYAIKFYEHELDKKDYYNCIEFNSVDECLPLINDDFCPTRVVKEPPIREVIE